MLIVCPNCATSYQIEPSSLGAAGRSVRCVRCKKVWFTSNPASMSSIARAHREDLAIYTSENSVGALAEPAAAAADVSPSPAAAASLQQPLPDEPAPALVPDPEPEAAEVLVRDDRGPAPLPDRRDEPAVPPITAEAPALAPAAHAGDTPAVTMPEHVEIAAARRQRPGSRRKSRWSGPGLPTAILALIAINTGLIAFRTDIARWLPQTASFYAAVGLPINVRGLVFTEVVTRKDMQEGVQMLVVEGHIKSESRTVVAVPRIRFAVRNAGGQEIYSWTALPEHNTLAPGATMTFRSRLASPPPESRAVLVRFFNTRDLVAGIQ